MEARNTNLHRIYRDAFFQGIGQEKAETLLSQNRRLVTSNTRASVHSIPKQRSISLSEAARLQGSTTGSHGEGTALIVENIDLQWITTLGVALNIDPSFFAEHVKNPRGAIPWKAIFGNWSRDHSKPLQCNLSSYSVQDADEIESCMVQSWHVDGVVEYDQYGCRSQRNATLHDNNHIPRTVAYDELYGWSSSTRISYMLVRPQLCV